MALATDYITAKAGIAERLRVSFLGFAAEMLRRRAFRQTVASLDVLTDRQLADLGLKRSEIRRIAYQAAYGS